MKCFKYGLLILLMKAGSCLAAQQLMPSPAQIEQFKSLSAEEKQALARSVGIDPASMSTNSAQPQIRELETPQRTAGDKNKAQMHPSPKRQRSRTSVIKTPT